MPVTEEKLKDALANLIVMENLPFTFVESKYFIDILSLYDERVTRNDFPMADTISSHVVAKYDHAKDCLRKQLSKIDSVNLTVDMWTSPNGKAILGITGHWLDDNWHLHDVLLDVVEVTGVHTGSNIAEYVVKSLRDFEISEKLFCITGDNATNNSTMAIAIGNLLPQFNFQQHLLGCVGHVLNIAAKKGLETICLNYETYTSQLIDDNEETDEETDMEDIEIEEFDDCSEHESILKRIRKIVSSVRNSPQKRAIFEQTNKSIEPRKKKRTRSQSSKTANTSSDKADEGESPTRYICYY